MTKNKLTISAQKNRKYSGIIMYKRIKNTLLIWKKTHYFKKNENKKHLIRFHIFLSKL